MFDFGKNWLRYSSKALDPARIEAAGDSLSELLGVDFLAGRSFLDIGCGSGIFALSASRQGASKVVGLDIDPDSIRASKINAEKYPVGPARPEFVEVSVLDREAMEAAGLFDVVYAWGSLHHTGRMWDAIAVASERVAPGGAFVLAIYNQHFTSPAWKAVKWLFNVSPPVGRKMMYYLFVPVVFLAKFAVTGKNPLKKRRGMDFFVDVLDLVGGYPYEYARPGEVREFLESRGLRLVKTTRPSTPIGCNEFVFRKS